MWCRGISPVRLKSRDNADKASAGKASGPGTEHTSTTSTATLHVPPADLTQTWTQSPSIPSIHLSTSPDQQSAIKCAFSRNHSLARFQRRPPAHLYLFRRQSKPIQARVAYPLHPTFPKPRVWWRRELLSHQPHGRRRVPRKR